MTAQTNKHKDARRQQREAMIGITEKAQKHIEVLRAIVPEPLLARLHLKLQLEIRACEPMAASLQLQRGLKENMRAYKPLNRGPCRPFFGMGTAGVLPSLANKGMGLHHDGTRHNTLARAKGTCICYNTWCTSCSRVEPHSSYKLNSVYIPSSTEER